jgi:excisionase family DNA binding protein
MESAAPKGLSIAPVARDGVEKRRSDGVRRQGLAFSRERVTIAEAAGILGVPERTVRDLAQRGELSGAKIGRRWTFDLGRLRDYVQNKETQAWQGARHRRAVSGGAAPSGAVFRPAAVMSDGRYRQTIQKLRELGAGRNGTGK